MNLIANIKYLFRHRHHRVKVICSVCGQLVEKRYTVTDGGNFVCHICIK